MASSHENIEMIYVEGNIGSGKSTLIKYLGDLEPNIEFFLEPVEQWENVKDSNEKSILEKFYSSMNRYAFALQSLAFLSRLQLLDSVDDRKPTIAERSIYSDMNVFALNCWQSGMLEDVEWEIYRRWFEWCENQIPCHVRDDNALFLYLRTDPDVCAQRVASRRRPGEAEITIEYLKQLHQRHEEWLNSQKRVIVVDANQDISSVTQDVRKALSHLLQSEPILRTDIEN